MQEYACNLREAATMKHTLRLRRVLGVPVVALMVIGAPIRCHAADSARAVIHTTRAVYPELAKRMRVQGQIVLMVTVLPSGKVADMRVESGHPLLVNAAEDAVRQWQFASGAETTTAQVKVDFALP